MELYRQTFTRLKQARQLAFIPYVTLGDPEPEVSLQIIKTLINAGADALELGIPFSDPLADGPTIQAATIRSLDSGTTPGICLEIIHEIKRQYPELAIGVLTYANIIHRLGAENFYRRAAAAKLDSVLVADLPLLESRPFYQTATTCGINSVFICPPNADKQTIQNIAQYSRGYVYLLSRAGVTGSENSHFAPLEKLIAALKEAKAAPIVQGFGISTPDQVRQAAATGVDGVISGSAVVNIIAANLNDNTTLLANLTAFVRAMKQATLS